MKDNKERKTKEKKHKWKERQMVRKFKLIDENPNERNIYLKKFTQKSY